MDDEDDMSWLPPGIELGTYEGDYKATIFAIRLAMEQLGFVPLCPERGCARARRCCGPLTPDRFVNPPCFRQYREEVRFLLLSPAGTEAIQQPDEYDGPDYPVGPGLVAWFALLSALLSAPPPKSPPKLIDALYGASPEARARLRRPKEVRCTMGWESDLDRFAGYMASGDWRVPLLHPDDRAPPHRVRAEA